MFKRDNRPDAPIDNLISVGTRIDGDVQFTGGMHLDGTVSGSVKPKDGAANRLVIGATGLVQGSVEAQIVELSGTVLGDIVAGTRIVLASTARIEGNLQRAIAWRPRQIKGNQQARGRSTNPNTDPVILQRGCRSAS
jgi:cytoskeletal protein CcmA (bactofilin family)